MLENYEGTALDTSMFQEPEVQPVEEPTQTEQVVETVAPTTQESTTETVATPTTFNIDGIGEVTADQIKEWKNGNMRQSDYTKKTQDLAKERAEHKDALELYSYLRSNPHIIEALKNADKNPSSMVGSKAPTMENELLRQLAYNQKAMETDMKLSALKQKYGEIDEVALLSKATEMRTDDLESVYKIITYDNRPTLNEADIIAKAKAELLAELKADKSSVSTMVNTRQTQTVEPKVDLTPEQKRVATAMGMSESEYFKWMNK